jgi:hypothetical protein
MDDGSADGLQRAEAVERPSRKAGFSVTRILIQPALRGVALTTAVSNPDRSASQSARGGSRRMYR